MTFDPWAMAVVILPIVFAVLFFWRIRRDDKLIAKRQLDTAARYQCATVCEACGLALVAKPLYRYDVCTAIRTEIDENKVCPQYSSGHTRLWRSSQW